MTRIDFYVLQSDTEETRLNFACRLAEKAQAQGNTVMIYTEDLSSSEVLDALLWRYQPQAYLPHAMVDDALAADTEIPVVIAHEKDHPAFHDLLICLTHETPKQFARFQRVAEIVNQQPHHLNASRKNYAFYKSRGYPINTHKLKC